MKVPDPGEPIPSPQRPVNLSRELPPKMLGKREDPGYSGALVYMEGRKEK